MPNDTHTALRSELRCHQILDAASHCFRLYGFHGCSMHQLAREAGMSVGHIYHYFTNKEAIIDAIVKRDLDKWSASIESLLACEQIFQVILEQLGQMLDKRLDPEHAALQIEIMAEAGRNPKVAQMVAEADLHVRQSVCRLLQQGSQRPLSPTELDAKFEMLSAIFDGLMARVLRDPTIKREPLLQCLRHTIRFILLEN